MTPESHLQLGRRFGPVEGHAIVKGIPGFPEIVEIVREPYAATDFGETWHSDLSFEEHPISVSILRALQVPACGNDTLWSSMYAAYDGLSDGLKSMLSQLHAVHGAGRAARYTKSDRLENTVEHPVVRTHPVTGRKALYVNSMFTYRFAGWTDEESLPLLNMLYAHMARPEYTVRFRWRPGCVAIWDNRVVQHIALNDYNGPERRVMQRVTVAGERPV